MFLNNRNGKGNNKICVWINNMRYDIPSALSTERRRLMAFQPRTPCMGEGMIVCMQRTPVLVLTYPELEITHHKANIFSIVHYHSLLFIIAIIRIIIGTVIIIFLMMINQEQVNINLSGGLRLGKYPSNKSMFFLWEAYNATFLRKIKNDKGMWSWG